MKKNALDMVAASGVLPVITVPSPDAALPLAEAILRGGLNAIEVTLRNECGLGAIAAISAAHPEMAVGAGTVLEESQVAAAKEAGAEFLVAPGFDRSVVQTALDAGIPFVPGVTNPSEITVAFRMGLRTLKFFPAEPCGGIPALKLFHAPFPDIRFVTTGGMCLDNLADYLALPFVAASGGSFMAKSADVKAGAWDKIEETCRKCAEIARAARGR